MSKKEKFNCAYCGEEIWRETRYKAENHFCDQKCQYAYFHKHYDYIYKNCEVCGIEMKLDKHRKKQRFCSLECRREWYSKTMIGENAAHFNSVKKNCGYCGKELMVCKNRLERCEHYFCDKYCKDKWFTEIYSQTDDFSMKNRISSAKALADGKMPFTMTKPHKRVCEMLDENSIDYVCEFQVVYYSVDISLDGSNLLIEVMGDYWHSNPTTKHFNNIDAKRKDIIRKDRSKHSFIKNKYNTEVLYLWETDINQNAELCIGLIKEYIECDGHLDNYDSFNYHIDGDDVVVNDAIIDSNITTNKEI